MVRLSVNGDERELDVPADMPLLWALRDVLGLTGTKYGCGIAQCGACTVHLDGVPARACVTPVSAVGARRVTTIEGLSADRSHPVQRAWIEEDVPQCGYCQSGQIMSASALLARAPRPVGAALDGAALDSAALDSAALDSAIDEAMRGNLCRCGTYPRVRRAIHRAARLLEEEGS